MTEYDPEIFTNNPDVIAGDSGIVFKTGNSGLEYLGKGDPLREGDLIVAHHSSDGDIITHGRSRIGVGDKVILVKSKDGDIYALKAGRKNPYRDCPLIPHVTHDLSVLNDPPHEDTYLYKKYIIDLGRPIQRVDGAWPAIHLRMDFDVEYHNEGFQSWYPYGGVWLGVSETGHDDDWYWCVGTGSPYITIAGPPMWEGNTNGDNQFCVTNWLGGCPLCCPPSFDEINYLHIHIRNTSSLYWGGFVKTRLLYVTLCEGDVTEGWCDSLRDIRDILG